MLNLQRRRGEKIYIEDEPLTILQFHNTFLVYEYQGTLTLLQKDVPIQIDETTTIQFDKRIRQIVRFKMKSVKPVYREEIYLKRKQEPTPSSVENK